MLPCRSRELKLDKAGRKQAAYLQRSGNVQATHCNVLNRLAGTASIDAFASWSGGLLSARRAAVKTVAGMAPGLRTMEQQTPLISLNNYWPICFGNCGVDPLLALLLLVAGNLSEQRGISDMCVLHSVLTVTGRELMIMYADAKHFEVTNESRGKHTKRQMTIPSAGCVPSGQGTWRLSLVTSAKRRKQFHLDAQSCETKRINWLSNVCNTEQLWTSALFVQQTVHSGCEYSVESPTASETPRVANLARSRCWMLEPDNAITQKSGHAGVSFWRKIDYRWRHQQAQMSQVTATFQLPILD